MEPLHGVHTLTSVLRTLIVPALAATAVVACGSASVAPAASAASTHVLSGSGFSAQYPITWSSSGESSKGVTAYELSSSGPLNASGVPAAGAIGITVLVEPLSVLAAAGARNLATSTPAQLITGVVGTPPDAVGVTVATAIHSVHFDGDSAAAVTLTYTTGGTPNVQEDQLDKHGLSVYLVELDTEPSMKAAGEAAVASLVKSWTWSTS
jgi:hypothetical protein